MKIKKMIERNLTFSLFRICWSFFGVLCAFILVFLILFIIYDSPLVYDCTQEGLFSLSEPSRNVLNTFENVPVRLINIHDGRTEIRVYERVEAFQRMLGSALFRFEYIKVDSIRDVVEVKAYIEQYQLSQANVVIVEIEGRYKVIPYASMVQYDYSNYQVGSKTIQSLSVQKEIVSTLHSLSQKKQKKVMFLSGHGEKSLLDNSPRGVSQLRSVFSSQNILCDDHFSWEKLSPSSCDLLIVLSPQKALLKEEQQSLIQFVEQGGSILICMDPGSFDLSFFLNRFGVRIEDKVLVDPGVQIPFVPLSNLIVAKYSTHQIVQQFADKGVVTMFPVAAPLVFEEKQGLSHQALLKTTDSAWASSNWRSGEIKKAESDLQGGLPLVVFVEGISIEKSDEISQSSAIVSEQPEDGFVALPQKEEKGIMNPEDTPLEGLEQTSLHMPIEGSLIVCGDSDFLINEVIAALGNRELISAFVNGLIGQTELLTVDPTVVKKVRLSGVDQTVYRVMINLLTFGVAFLWTILGVFVWIRRRV